MSTPFYNNLVMSNFLFICWAVLVLYILQETDAIPQWGKLLRLKFTKYEGYEKQVNTSLGLNLKYTHYLLSKHPNFFVNLITCQECLAVWLCIGGFALFWKQLGGVWAFGATTLGVILGVAVFKFLLRKIYE